MLDVKEVITNYNLVDIARTSTFQQLRDEAIQIAITDVFTAALRTGEDEYMSEHYSQDLDAKKKNGEWKYRTYLPNAYNSAKSVIVGCMSHDIDMSDKGKTELQKLLKEARAGITPPKSDFERCQSAVRTIEKYYPDLNMDDAMNIQQQLRVIV